MHPGFPGPGNGLLDDGPCQSVNLNVHLDGSDAIPGSANLKIHIAEEIFQALDVGKHQIIIIRIPGHKTA